MSELPDTWTSTSLKTVANLVTGNTPSTKSPEYYGGNVPFVKPGDLDSADPITATEQHLTELGAQQSRLVRAGSTLVSCIGNLGKVGFAGVPLATNQQINSAEFHNGIVDDRYGYYLCKTLKPWMERESSATTIAILNKGKFGEAPFPLAPLAEQKRIADKLDTFLTRVDAVNTRLARVAPLLKRFRQSVLAAATSGRLTEDWRDSESMDSWNEVTCGSVSEFHNGYAFKSEIFKSSGDIQIVKLANIKDGHLKLVASPTFVNTSDVIDQLSQQPNPGDVLISMTGTRYKRDYGFVCVIPKDAQLLINQRVGRLVPAPSKVSSKFLMISLMSSDFRDQFFSGETGGVNQGNVGSNHIKSCKILCPSIEEQTEIVRRVETLFAFADRLEARLAQAQTAATRLPPALLAKAFRGELVPQDPNDEPAAELLRRLAQAPAAASPRKGRKAVGAAV